MKHNTDYIGALIECNSEKAEYAEINQDFKEDISNLLTIGKIYNFHVSNRTEAPFAVKNTRACILLQKTSV